MKKIVVDSSIIIEFLRTGKGEWLSLVDMVGDKKAVIIVPAVVLGEIWSGKTMSSVTMRKNVMEVLSIAEIVDIKRNDALLAGELRRNFNIPLMDGFIAACTINHKAHLATLNIKDFEKVKRLKLLK